MQYYTSVRKTIHCQFWDINLSIHGKYRIIGDSYEAKFMHGICPIIENNKLPENQRNKDLAIYAFCQEYPCNKLNSFKPIINILKNGYSQT
nr:MAG TPA: hypothetical protein [Inoviridae sp.]